MSFSLRAELGGLVPGVLPPRAMRLPTVGRRLLDSGLTVVAARRPGVPRVEARLLVPAARAGRAADPARSRLLAKTMMSGTPTHSSVEVARELQRLGGHLEAHADTDHFVVSGSALAHELPAFLALLGEVLASATHPADEVALQRQVLAQEITLSQSQPTTLVGEAFRRRMFADHAYGRGQPRPEQVVAVTPAQVRSLHAGRVRPEGAVLVLVGDVTPARAIDRAEEALAGWATGGAGGPLAPARPAPAGPALLVDRPGSVQTNLRLGGPAVGRTDPDYPALAVANLIFGGYFVSRLVDNIRERRGYTYSPGSAVQQKRAASWFVVRADVGTEVTGPALVEIRYELGRMLAGPVDEDELAAAKRYLSGTLAMSVQTQAGLASYLATLAVNDLPLEWLREYPARAQAVTAAEVVEAARRYMDPRRLHTVMLGDAAAIRATVEALDEVEVAAGD